MNKGSMLNDPPTQGEGHPRCKQSCMRPKFGAESHGFGCKAPNQVPELTEVSIVLGVNPVSLRIRV